MFPMCFSSFFNFLPIVFVGWLALVYFVPGMTFVVFNTIIMCFPTQQKLETAKITINSCQVKKNCGGNFALDPHSHFWGHISWNLYGIVFVEANVLTPPSPSPVFHEGIFGP